MNPTLVVYLGHLGTALQGSQKKSLSRVGFLNNKPGLDLGFLLIKSYKKQQRYFKKCGFLTETFRVF
jgi:hypothetical protein